MHKKILITTLMLAMGISAQADVSIDFATAADFDSNFVVYSSSLPSDGAWNASGYYAKADSFNSSALIYNSLAVGGTGGVGGSALGATLNKFGGTFTVQVDYATRATATGNTLGIYTHVSDAVDAGYAALFRFDSNGTSVNFRLFDSDGNPSSRGVGTLLVNESIAVSGTPVAVDGNTFYTLTLEVTTNASSVDFNATISEQGGSVIAAFTTATDTTAPRLDAGQVGFRISSAAANDASADILKLDNFAIMAEGSTELWADFEVGPGTSVDTGDFMGWIDIAQKPWIWSYSLESWIYMPEGNVTSIGSWGYVAK